jgi:putative IMPACT (imprinted ancient) family translation regulator
MYSFSLDLSQIISSNFWESLLNDFELVKSFNHDTIQVFKDNLKLENDSSETREISFKLNLKLEIEIDKSFNELIQNLKLSQIIINENTAALPYWIKFDLKDCILNVSFYVFWMKKKLNEFESFRDGVDLEDIKDAVFFSIIEAFKNIIEIPEKNVLINWLQEIKEENVIKFLNAIPIENIIFGQSNHEEENPSVLNISKTNNDQGLNLLIARSDKLTSIKKIKNAGSSNKIVQSNNNEQYQDAIYKKFFEEGGVVGEILTDRGSTFQSHAIKIVNQKQIQLYLNYLKSNNKIIKATHNILAFRLTTGDKKTSNLKESISEGFDDDGEDGAGIRLLGLLQKMKVNNIMIVVSRWFGGTFLGTDRFKHINDSAKNIITAYKNNFEFLP